MIFPCLSRNSFFCSLEIVQQDLFLLDEKMKQKIRVIPSEIGKIRNRDFSIQEKGKMKIGKPISFIVRALDGSQWLNELSRFKREKLEFSGEQTPDKWRFKVMMSKLKLERNKISWLDDNEQKKVKTKLNLHIGLNFSAVRSMKYEKRGIAVNIKFKVVHFKLTG